MTVAARGTGEGREAESLNDLPKVTRQVSARGAPAPSRLPIVSLRPSARDHVSKLDSDQPQFLLAFFHPGSALSPLHRLCEHRGRFYEEGPFQERHKTCLQGKQFPFSPRFTHHNTFPFQWRPFSLCASRFQICNIKDQLQRRASFLHASPILPQPRRFSPLVAAPGKEGPAPSPQVRLMMAVKTVQLMLMITVDTSKS